MPRVLLYESTVMVSTVWNIQWSWLMENTSAFHGTLLLKKSLPRWKSWKQIAVLILYFSSAHQNITMSKLIYFVNSCHFLERITRTTKLVFATPQPLRVLQTLGVMVRWQIVITTCKMPKPPCISALMRQKLILSPCCIYCMQKRMVAKWLLSIHVTQELPPNRINMFVYALVQTLHSFTGFCITSSKMVGKIKII